MALVSVVGITALLRLPPSVELVFAGRLRAIAVLVLSSVIAGASEAVLFALSARTVLALAQSARSVTISFGEIRGELRIETMFALMLALALVRILLQTLNAFLPAKLVAEVFSDLQTTIVTKFLNADWSLQARMRTGTFQDILTNQASRVATVVHHGAMAISAATIFVSLIGSAFLVGRWIAFVIVITAGALVLGLRPLLNRGRRIAHQYAAAGQRLAELSSEVSHIGEEIYVLGVAGNASQPLLTEISRVKRLLFKGQFGIQLVSTAYSGLVGLILVVGLFAVYASGASGRCPGHAAARTEGLPAAHRDVHGELRAAHLRARARSAGEEPRHRAADSTRGPGQGHRALRGGPLGHRGVWLVPLRGNAVSGSGHERR
jgi:hypothetical protein